MIRDITIGQYYSGNSVIHRMDPRTKLAITFLYAISLFLCKDWIMILAAELVPAPVWKSSGMQKRIS